MNLKFLVRVSICLLGCAVYAQQPHPTIEIQPYLQDVEPNRATVMWQTSTGGESVVEWGKTPKLGKRTSGKEEDINFTDSRVHTVTLEGLDRFTTYYYRVRTGKLRSDVFQFKTPPFAEDGEAFNLMAMSDMQYDHNAPDKFYEVVNQGVLEYLEKEYGGSLPDNLAMVMIPGDLVENGGKYQQWQDHFFKPAKDLFSQVPVYPVPGNHERNSVYYFKYFELPKNGSPEYAEHWWYKDYGNTRILGLDSNKGYRDLGEQMQWLEKILKETAANDDIDFVFAQMHHPHKSELWIPGEEDFSGKVVAKLEAFTEQSGKPSIHFFGHTHGYSRGQSKDHKHLWVNVATAGGAIDNWGEFEGRDYDEFTVTQDEYGFVMVEVDPNNGDPKFTLKRISRGNQYQQRENEVTDSITVWRSAVKPMAPRPNNVVEAPMARMGGTLKASQFESSKQGAFHAASNWQVSATPNFEKLVVDSWKQHENWYYKENRQAGDDLTDEQLEVLLQPNTQYYWRVRYRDQYLNWSDWSDTATFTTQE